MASGSSNSEGLKAGNNPFVVPVVLNTLNLFRENENRLAHPKKQLNIKLKDSLCLSLTTKHMYAGQTFGPGETVKFKERRRVTIFPNEFMSKIPWV